MLFSGFPPGTLTLNDKLLPATKPVCQCVTSRITNTRIHQEVSTDFQKPPPSQLPTLVVWRPKQPKRPRLRFKRALQPPLCIMTRVPGVIRNKHTSLASPEDTLPTEQFMKKHQHKSRGKNKEMMVPNRCSYYNILLILSVMRIRSPVSRILGVGDLSLSQSQNTSCGMPTTPMGMLYHHLR